MLWASAVPYVVSFFLPAAGTDLGWEVFRFLLLELPIGIVANPLAWIGWFCLASRRSGAAWKFGLAATFCAAVWFPTMGYFLHIGYYVWVLSFVVLTVGAYWITPAGGHLLDRNDLRLAYRVTPTDRTDGSA